MAINSGPGVGAAAVTPSDSAEIAESRGIYVGGSGDLRVDMANGDTVTFTGVSAGVIHAIRVRRVYATGTTATGIVAVY